MQTDMTLATGARPVAPRPAHTVTGLSKRQKAAIVVRLLHAEGVQLSLADLPEALQIGLTEDMSALRYVHRDTLRAVIEEFLAELDSIGLAFPGGIHGALSVLDGTISTATATRLRRKAGLGAGTDPWVRMSELDSTRLLPILEEESVEIAAVMLSKLKVSKSAELLGLLPGQRARQITYAISQTGAIAPGTVDKIGAALLARLDAETPQAFADGPVERVGAILNSSLASTRQEMLDGLDAEDAGFAEQVRRAIFTFANIPERIDPRDVPKITRDVDQTALVTALAAAMGREAEAAAAEFILANMSQRMAAQLRGEMEDLGRVRERDAESAMAVVVTAIRNLEAAGEIFLIAGDE